MHGLFSRVFVCVCYVCDFAYARSSLFVYAFQRRIVGLSVSVQFCLLRFLLCCHLRLFVFCLFAVCSFV